MGIHTLWDISDDCRDIYLWIFEFTTKKGYQPTFMEIKDQFGYKSVNSISHYTTQLKRFGYIDRGNKNKSMRFIFLKTPDGKKFKGFKVCSS